MIALAIKATLSYDDFFGYFLVRTQESNTHLINESSKTPVPTKKGDKLSSVLGNRIELGLIQPVIKPLLLHQGFMGSLLYYTAAVQYQNMIR